MDAIIINRVSDAHQLEGYSLDVQEREGRKYAERQGFNIVKVFSFQETASKHNQRKVFDDIICYITNRTKKSPLAVVAEKHDRLYRNHLSKAKLQIFLEEGKIEIHLYKEGKKLTKDSPPSEFLVDDVMTSVSQYAARNIGREARKGMMGKAQEGWLPHKAPFGYLNVYPSECDNKNRRRGIIEPAPWGELLIPRMFELRAKGFSLDLIHQKVKDEGLVPTHRFAHFHRSMVEKVLKNPFYMGEFIWAGERCQGKHRPLISKKLWFEVQQTFGKVLTMERRRKHVGVFTGFLKCACGCSVTYDPKDKPSGKHYDYYRCANGKKVHPKLVYASEEGIFNQFDPAVESISISEQLAKDISEALNRTEEKAHKAHLKHIEDLKARYREMENAEDTLYDDLKRGVLDEEGFKKQIARVRNARQHLADVLGAAQSEVTGAVLVTAKKILELAQRAPELYSRRSPEERRAFLEKILSNPVLDGLSVRYELKKPFQILSEMASSPTLGG